MVPIVSAVKYIALDLISSRYLLAQSLASPNILLFELGVNDEINKRFYSDLRFVLRLHIRTCGKNKMDICTAHSMCRLLLVMYSLLLDSHIFTNQRTQV